MRYEKIDVHTHIVPPFWREAAITANKIPTPPLWDEEKHLAFMKRCNISKSIVSVTSPGTYLVDGADEEARSLARRCNEWVAEVKKRHPDRFGYWASLPLPDVQGSVEEIRYVFDELNPDGVAMLTNHNGVYLGDSQFDPVFEELNRRKATVFVHPTIPCMRHEGKLVNAMPLKGLPPGIAEYIFEEVRVILNLLTTKTVTRYPEVNFIIPHGGGAFPPVIERFSCFGTWIFGGKEELSSDEIKNVMRKQFFFDLTGFPLPDQIHGLMRFVNPSRMLFGTDYPYIREESGEKLARKLDEELETVIESEEQRLGVFKGNAMKMLTRRHE